MSGCVACCHSFEDLTKQFRHCMGSSRARSVFLSRLRSSATRNMKQQFWPCDKGVRYPAYAGGAVAGVRRTMFVRSRSTVPEYHSDADGDPLNGFPYRVARERGIARSSRPGGGRPGSTCCLGHAVMQLGIIVSLDLGHTIVGAVASRGLAKASAMAEYLKKPSLRW